MLTASDRELALARLHALAGAPVDTIETVVFVHPGRPFPKARPRWSPRNQRFYTPKTTEEAEVSLAWAWKNARVGQPPYRDTLALVTLFFFGTTKWTAGDGDNCLKTVMDAGNKARIWTDDRQVKAATWVIEVDLKAPRTVVAVQPFLNSLTRAPLLLAPER